ncbi:MAG: chromosomal replication initiator protein DnaA [Deltaproteobacteria bacterium]|nr:chromosomal replication initiator protein DnaA [Deltaproteobacteria bacterium]
MQATNVWKSCLDGITGHISAQHFATWFKPIKFLGADDTTIELEVPNKFFLEWIKEHYLSLISDVIRKVTSQDYSIAWKISNDGKVPEVEQQKQTPRAATKKKTTESGVSSKYTFDNFIVGAKNEFAHAACLAVTKNPGSKYNPLFIYGGVGLGKTHLLQAIGNKIAEAQTPTNVCYYTSERFMNEFINYVSRNKMDDFRKKFRNIDVLLIDDVQFWGGKERTQEEFFHTFNELYEAHKQIVVTCDKFPKEIDGMEERLRSRFEWGLIADIQPPDMETKIAILKNKSLAEAVDLPNDVATWLASVSSSNIRELEGYLNRVIAVSSLTGQEISLIMAKEALKNLTRERGVKNVTIEEIQKAVAEIYNLKNTDLKSKRRHKNIALPRQLAMYIARQFGKYSYPEIGESFGGKDHSTAIHAVKKIEKELSNNHELKEKIQIITNKLGVN